MTMFTNMAVKSGARSVHILDPPHCQKVRGSGLKDPHYRIAGAVQVNRADDV